MTAAKETTLKEVGEVLGHVVEHMATKKDVVGLDARIDCLKTEMIVNSNTPTNRSEPLMITCATWLPRLR